MEEGERRRQITHTFGFCYFDVFCHTFGLNSLYWVGVHLLCPLVLRFIQWEGERWVYRWRRKEANKWERERVSEWERYSYKGGVLTYKTIGSQSFYFIFFFSFPFSYSVWSFGPKALSLCRPMPFCPTVELSFSFRPILPFPLALPLFFHFTLSFFHYFSSVQQADPQKREEKKIEETKAKGEFQTYTHSHTECYFH